MYSLFIHLFKEYFILVVDKAGNEKFPPSSLWEVRNGWLFEPRVAHHLPSVSLCFWQCKLCSQNHGSKIIHLATNTGTCRGHFDAIYLARSRCVHLPRRWRVVNAARYEFCGDGIYRRHGLVVFGLVNVACAIERCFAPWGNHPAFQSLRSRSQT